MNKKGFSLVELLAVIVILGILLAIAIPAITGVIDRATREAFAQDIRMFIRALNFAKMGDETFDPTTVMKQNGVDNIYEKIRVASNNYERVQVITRSEDIYVMIHGQNKWADLVGCGNFSNVIVDGGDCEGLFFPPSISFSPNGTGPNYIRTTNVTITITDTNGVDNASLKYLWQPINGAIPIEQEFVDQIPLERVVETPSNENGAFYLWVLAKNIFDNMVIDRSDAFHLDNTPPIITIEPPNPITINVGQIYVDPGATAFDNIDGDITGNIVPTNNINIAVPDTYLVTYTVSDSSGNVATANRTVHVVAIPPSSPGAFTSPTGMVMAQTIVSVAWGTTTSWGNPSTNPNYRVEVSYNGGAWNLVANTGTNTSTNHTVANGFTSLQYRVRSESNGGNSSWVNSSVISIEPYIDVAFSYTGSMQTWTVPKTGRYRIEVWGAQGGGAGGLGGYAWGEINLTIGNTVNIFVGGQGGTGGTSVPGGAGGWNGGAAGGSASWSGSGGGGASDVRIGGTGTNNRVIVGGGGGGSYYQYQGGAGGGGHGMDNSTTGCCPESYPTYIYVLCAAGGTGASGAGNGGGGSIATTYGSCTGGTGGNGTTAGVGGAGGVHTAGGGGGGGGYGGGGGGGGCGPTGVAGTGGGGSSFIGGMINDATRGTQAGVRTGHGYIRIRIAP
jgi:prepilin-type N-terminal cleavage/methylation domain-containing protein